MPRHGLFMRCTVLCLGVVAILVAGSLTGCGDDGGDGSAETVDLAVWVAQFDTICAQVAAQLDPSASGMTAAEMSAFNAGALTVLRALSPPDEQAEDAAELIETLAASQQPGLDPEDMSAVEQRLLAAMADLGISDACSGRPPRS